MPLGTRIGPRLVGAPYHNSQPSWGGGGKGTGMHIGRYPTSLGVVRTLSWRGCRSNEGLLDHVLEDFRTISSMMSGPALERPCLVDWTPGWLAWT